VSNYSFESQVSISREIVANISAFNIFAQFTCRVWHPEIKEHYAWSSTNLEEFSIDEQRKTDFTSDRVKLSLSEDYTTYTFQVSINPKTIIDVCPNWY